MKSIFLLSLFLITACGKGDDDRLKEKTKSESESQLEAENENLGKKATEMEKDLSRRHLFYQAIKGVYEGTITTSNGTFNIRLTFSPTISPVTTTRTRQLDEIVSDLNNLALNTQVIQWDPNNVNASVGCPGTAVRPNIERGEVIIPSSADCKNLYTIKVTERSSTGTQSENNEMAARIARQVLRGDLREIDSLIGTIQPSTNASIFKFVANKVQE